MKMENLKLKKLKEQVIVITGASSGIGLATARMAAKRGAKVVLSSRNERELRQAVADIRKKGGQAIAVVADVSSPDDMKNLRDKAVGAFGRIDTWVNNAGASIFGSLLEVPLEEEKKLFDINFWGVRHGSRVAVPVLAQQGGALINIGSEVSERAAPLQGIYSATKHAVKAYTDALRMEIEKADYPVSVSLIRPAAIDTPFPQHAANRLPHGEPSLPGPVYHPDIVAEAILECAETPKRDVFVGGASKFFSVMESFFPRLTDLYMEYQMFDKQARGAEVQGEPRDEALMGPAREEGRISGGYRGHVAKRSLFTSMSLHPIFSLVAGIGAAALAVGASRALSQGQVGERRFGARRISAEEARASVTSEGTFANPTPS